MFPMFRHNELLLEVFYDRINYQQLREQAAYPVAIISFIC